MIRIKEILKTDSLAGSRIIINSNFKNLKNEFTEIDNFFKFDKDTNTRVALTSPYIESDEVITKKITGADNLEIYSSDIICARFNNDGELVIRDNSELTLNVNQSLKDLSSRISEINAAAYDRLLSDDEFLEKLKEKLLADESFILSIANSIKNWDYFEGEEDALNES